MTEFPMNATLKLYFLLFLVSAPYAQKEAEILPEQLGTLRLVESMQGSDAQSFLNRLHDKEVAPKHSLMGHYASDAAKATLYVSVYESPLKAADASKRMSARIRDGNPVFRHYGEFTAGKLSVGRCVGLGQVHFFFVHREKVYWLAADPSPSTEVLDALLKFVVGSAKRR